MDLYSSDVGQIQEGNMRTQSVNNANRAIQAHNTDVANNIRQLKGQQKSAESSSIMGETTQQFWAAGKLPSAQKAFTDFTSGATDFKGNPIGAVKGQANDLASAAKEGQAGSAATDLKDTGDGIFESSEELAGGTGRTLGKTALRGLATGAVGIGALAQGGFDIFKDVQASDDGKGFHIAGDNWASKTSNVLGIAGSIADLGGTVFPPLALIGGVADIAGAAFGEVGAVKDEKKEEGQDAAAQASQTESTIASGGISQATTGRVQG